MGDLIPVNFQKIRLSSEELLAYRAKIFSLDKYELMVEMVSFQEERSRLGHLTPQMMITGQILFKALHDAAETQELKLLTKSYCNHLKYEHESYMKGTNDQLR